MTQPLTHHRPASPISTDKQAKDEIKALRTELDNQKRRMVSPSESNANSGYMYFKYELFLKNKPAEKLSDRRVLKGASLANPNKKARKYAAIEFESDEE